MPEFPGTVESLILRVRDLSNRAAWDQFERLYRPVIFRIARARGLQHADAVDLVQQVLISVASAIDRYEKRDGGPRFRNWLSRIARNAVLKALTRQPVDRAAGGTAVMDVLAEVSTPDPGTDALITLEYRRELFRLSAETARAEVEESTWLAFELTVLQDTPVERAAELLGTSTGAIYAARSRIMRKIRNSVSTLDDSAADDEVTHESQ